MFLFFKLTCNKPNDSIAVSVNCEIFELLASIKTTYEDVKRQLQLIEFGIIYTYIL